VEGRTSTAEARERGAAPALAAGALLLPRTWAATRQVASPAPPAPELSASTKAPVAAHPGRPRPFRAALIDASDYVNCLLCTRDSWPAPPPFDAQTAPSSTLPRHHSTGVNRRQYRPDPGQSIRTGTANSASAALGAQLRNPLLHHPGRSPPIEGDQASSSTRFGQNPRLKLTRSGEPNGPGPAGSRALRFLARPTGDQLLAIRRHGCAAHVITKPSLAAGQPPPVDPGASLVASPQAGDEGER